MEADYVVACGIIWRKTADPVAGWELVEALGSDDQEIRLLAQSILTECGEASMNLLESAVATGMVKPDFAGPCMTAILRSQNRMEGWDTNERILN